VQSQVFVGVPVKDPVNDRCLLFVDLHVGRNTVATGNVAISERHSRPEDLSLSRTVELAPPVPLGELGALVLRHGSLNLRQQGRLRIVAGGLLDKQ
jgi:hypothetical protein